MEQSLWTGKTGLDTQRRILENIANNLANVNTTAFKRGRAHSTDIDYQAFKVPGAQENSTDIHPTGIMVGKGSEISGIAKNYEQGSLIQTNNPVDMAISGDGFFQITQADGTTAYTRSGNFQLSSTGQIVNQDGLVVQPGVTIPTGSTTIIIGSDGSVSVRQPGSSDLTQVGNIELATFINPAGLEPIGNNLYLETPASGTPTTGTPGGTTGAGTIDQGSLETSNVNVVEELVLLIEAQRAFEVVGKGVETSKDVLEFAINTIP